MRRRTTLNSITNGVDHNNGILSVFSVLDLEQLNEESGEWLRENDFWFKQMKSCSTKKINEMLTNVLLFPRPGSSLER